MFEVLMLLCFLYAGFAHLPPPRESRNKRIPGDKECLPFPASRPRTGAPSSMPPIGRILRRHRKLPGPPHQERTIRLGMSRRL